MPAHDASSTEGAVPVLATDEQVVVEPGPSERLQRTAALGQMAEEIAHELGNAVGALGVLAASFRSDPTLDRQRLDVMDQAIDSMRKLLQQVTDFGLPNPTSASPTSIRTLLIECEDLIRVVAPDHLVLTVAADAGDALVTLSLQELQQVLLNLVLNARDATPPGGTISIGSETSPDGVSLTVSDNGVGMDRETLRRVFDRHYSTKSEGGSGLGLTICREIVERHGGRLVASSEVHQGSTLTVTLPLCRRPSDCEGSR